jgi:hypothetical protein
MEQRLADRQAQPLKNRRAPDRGANDEEANEGSLGKHTNLQRQYVKIQRSDFMILDAGAPP